MNMIRIAIAALMWIAIVAVSHAALPPGITGSWYNPAQPGHGITIEILDSSRALGGWYVYDPAGNPFHLYLEGAIDGTAIDGIAYSARGMRFGSFNPSDNRALPWGRVTLEFSSCDAATLRWNADGVAGAGYGRGEMSLRRLTQIASLNCVFTTAQGLLPKGTYSGSWDRTAGGHGTRPYPLYAAVDAQGRLWAAPEFTPGVTFVSSLKPPPTFFGAVGVREGASVVLPFDVRYNRGFGNEGGAAIALPVSFSLGTDGSVSASARTIAQPALVERFNFARDASAADSLRRDDFDPASLTGRTFSIPTLEQFFGPGRADVLFLDGHRFCIPARASCEFAGRIGAVDSGLAMFDIEIDDTRAGGRSYAGKAWLAGSPQRLMIVTHDGVAALSGVGTER